MRLHLHIVYGCFYTTEAETQIKENVISPPQTEFHSSN